MAVTVKRFTDKSFKVLLILMVLFVGVFVQPRHQIQSVEAAGPLLLVPVLGGIVGDIAVDMGIDFIDKKAQKAASDNVAKKLWDKYGDEIQKWKPTKKNVGKWALEVPKWFVAGAVDEIGDYVSEVKPKTKQREQEGKELTKPEGKSFTRTITGETDPFYKTDVHIRVSPYKWSDSAENQAAYAFVLKYAHVEVTPLAYEQASLVKFCIADSCASRELTGGYYMDIGVGFYASKNGVQKGISVYEGIGATGFLGDHTEKIRFSSKIGSAYVPAFEKYKDVLSKKQKEIYDFDGILVSDDVETVIQLDNNLTPAQLKQLDYSKLPEAYQKDKEFEFELEPSLEIDLSGYEDGQEIEWEVIQQDIEYKVNNETIYNTYNFDYEPVINNYYTLTPEKQDDLDKQVIIIIENDIDNGVVVPGVPGAGAGDGFKYCVDKVTKEVVACKDIEAIDGGLITYIKNAYDYAVNAVKSGVDGINTIVAGSAGLMTLYGQVFGWLPPEATTILVSGMLLMIGLRVFRK